MSVKVPDYIDQVKRLKKQESDASKRLDKLYDLYMTDRGDEFTSAKMAQIKEEILRLRTQIKEAENRQAIAQSTTFDIDKIIDTFQKQLKQKQSPEFIKTLFELAVKNVIVYPDKIKVVLLVTQERFELPTP